MLSNLRSSCIGCLALVNVDGWVVALFSGAGACWVKKLSAMVFAYREPLLGVNVDDLP